MANEQNLRPFNERSKSEQRAIQSRGGKASVESRRARKTLREELIALLATDITDKEGNKQNAQVAISLAMIREAFNGNVRAFNSIRDTIGEMPELKMNVSQMDFSELNKIDYGKQGEK